ncbi:MAG: DUF3368 domain-containing protein [Saprospiraceae bacterium]|nr:DUF3368 domain-containing protein [Saprospiraceae bacterium]
MQDKEGVEALVPALDPGEAEAIILAKETQATFLVIDERKGRKLAEAHGLRIIGLLGVLIQAKKKGYIDLLRPILDTLIDQIGFRVSQQLYVRILAEVGE